MAAAIASGAVLDAGATGPTDTPAATASGDAAARTALVVDAALSSRGRELVDPRLRDLDADVRLPRTSEEARTNVRYFDELGYRLVVAGPDATAAASATHVAAEQTPDLPSALAATGR